MIPMNRTQALTITSLGHFINDGNLFLMPLAYAFMVKYLGASTFIAGIAAGVFSIISMIASILVTRTSKLIGNTKSMGLGLILWGLSLALVGFSLKVGNYPIIFLSIVLAGIASAFYHPLGAAILSSAYGGTAGTALGINGAMGSLGRSIYQYLSMLLFALLSNNIFLAFLVLGVVSIALGIPPIFLTDPPHYDQKIVAKQTVDAKYSLIYVVIILTVISLLRGIFFQGVIQLLPTLLVKFLNYSYGTNLGLMMTIIYSVAIVGQSILGVLSDISGRRLIFGITSIGAVIGYALFYFTHDIWWILLFAFFALSSFPLSMALTNDLVPRSSATLASSIVWNVGNSGGMTLGPIIVGILSAFMPLPRAMLWISIAGLIASLLTIAIPKPPRKSKVPLFG